MKIVNCRPKVLDFLVDDEKFTAKRAISRLLWGEVRFHELCCELLSLTSSSQPRRNLQLALRVLFRSAFSSNNHILVSPMARSYSLQMSLETDLGVKVTLLVIPPSTQNTLRIG
nr:hypothetical protein HmN_000686800 [Hymenolepis microstoma]